MMKVKLSGRWHCFAWVLLAVVLLAGISPASMAADFPDHPIRLIVPFEAGPGPDFLARTIAKKMGEKFNWTFVVENRAGAGGNIGTDEVAKAKPDGYTLLMGHVGALAVNPSIYPKLPFDPEKYLTPISMVGTAPLVLVTGTQSRYKNLGDVIAAAKRGESVTFGYSGIGTISQLSGSVLSKAAGVRFQNVPYKRAADGEIDLISGRLDLYMSSVATLTSHIQSGKVRALAITSATRFPELPDVPTVAEQGFPGFNATTWFALMAPAGTAPKIVKKIHDALATVLIDPDLVKRFSSVGTVAESSSPQELAKFMASETRHWGHVVIENGIEVE